jgi:trehalose/maltose hydrolase-like predicted phosphorylase
MFSAKNNLLRLIMDRQVFALAQGVFYLLHTAAVVHVTTDVSQVHQQRCHVVSYCLVNITDLCGNDCFEGAGVPAKGLTGKAYEGHYFWDTEIYLLPFLIYTSPQVARNLLIFRYKMLAQARARARELGHRGAMFPWRTIGGEEASAYYAAGTAQYHINAVIMYAMRKYVQATGDDQFLRDYGAEMLVETARLWLDLGFYSDTKGGKFCITPSQGRMTTKPS